MFLPADGIAFSNEPILLPVFWQDTVLASEWFGNPAWHWLLALVVLILLFPLRMLLVKLYRRITTRLFPEDSSARIIATGLIPAIRLLIVMIGLSLVFQSGLLTFPDKVAEVIRRVIETLKTVILCLSLAEIGTGFINIRLQKAKENGNKESHTVFNFYRMTVYVAAVLLGIFMILSIWGFDITGLIAGLGVGGLAISLAAQDTFSNLLGGLTIMTDHSFAIGDVITTPDVEGIVEDIRFRSTKVRTFTQFLVTVPNKQLSNNSVTNLSRIGKRRVRFYINLEYGTRPEQIRHLIEMLKTRMESRDTIVPDSVLICLERFSSSSLDVLFQCFLQIVDFVPYLQEQEAILLDVMDVMAEEKLSFALSALTVHLNEINKQQDQLTSPERNRLPD